MGYDDLWEREQVEQWCRWDRKVWSRLAREEHLPPDERLDDLGWEIFYAAIARGVGEAEAARLAMNGNLRQRRLVREDMYRRLSIATRRRWRELNPGGGVALDVWQTQAPEQLTFWKSRLKAPSFVYFIQSGEHGPVKIGWTGRDPHDRLRKLQTGNPEELLLRHVIPADLATEKQLHTRFKPARIRLEWFGGEYLPVILAFASGLADEMMRAYDGTGQPPALRGGRVLSPWDLGKLRRDIERLWRRGHEREQIASFTGLDLDELDAHLREMRRSTLYDLGGRVIPMPVAGRRQRRSAVRRAS
jgi:hypothetical protein